MIARRLLYLSWVSGTVALFPVGFTLACGSIVLGSHTLGELSGLFLGSGVASGLGYLFTFALAEVPVPERVGPPARWAEIKRAEALEFRVVSIESAERRAGVWRGE